MCTRWDLNSRNWFVVGTRITYQAAGDAGVSVGKKPRKIHRRNSYGWAQRNHNWSDCWASLSMNFGKLIRVLDATGHDHPFLSLFFVNSFYTSIIAIILYFLPKTTPNDEEPVRTIFPFFPRYFSMFATAVNSTQFFWNNSTGALRGNAEYLVGSSAAHPYSSSARRRLHAVDGDTTVSQQQTDTTGQLTAPGARIPHDHINPESDLTINDDRTASCVWRAKIVIENPSKSRRSPTLLPCLRKIGHNPGESLNTSENNVNVARLTGPINRQKFLWSGRINTYF